jgi:hypothetical protein
LGDDVGPRELRDVAGLYGLALAVPPSSGFFGPAERSWSTEAQAETTRAARRQRGRNGSFMLST